jgi:hypothetical protein
MLCFRPYNTQRHHEDVLYPHTCKQERLGDRRGRKEYRNSQRVVSGLGDWGLMKMVICSAWPQCCSRACRGKQAGPRNSRRLSGLATAATACHEARGVVRIQKTHWHGSKLQQQSQTPNGTPSVLRPRRSGTVSGVPPSFPCVHAQSSRSAE